MHFKTARLFIRKLVPDDWKSMQKLAIDFLQSKYAVYDMPLPTGDAEIIALTKRLLRLSCSMRFCSKT